MAEFAAPQNYEGSEPFTVTVPITENTVNVGGGGLQFFFTAGSNWYRMRYANVSGTIAGSVGTVTIILSVAGGTTSPSPWFGVGFEAPAQPAVPINKTFNFTWSADIGDNYTGAGGSWDISSVMGLPLVYIPGGAVFQIRAVTSFGGDGVTSLDLGICQFEFYPHPGLGPSSDATGPNVYLLPQTI